MEIKQIQEWEKQFAKSHNLPPQKPSEVDKAMQAGFYKLIEEIGEVSKALHKKKYEKLQEEISDCIIFLCKIGKLTEDYHKQKPLDSVLNKTMKRTESRKSKDGVNLTKNYED